MKAYSCPSCGAELICDASTAATPCPYCGNPTVVPGQFSGALKPDFVIPFKLSREDAVAALKKHYKGKPRCPRRSPTATTLRRSRGLMSLLDVSTVRQRAAWTTKAGSSTSIKVVTTRSQRPHIMTCGAAVLLPLKRCPETPPVRCRMTTWTPLSLTTMRSRSPFPRPICRRFLADKYDVSVEQSRSGQTDVCTASLEGALRRTTTE